MNVGVLVVSDRASRGDYEDRGGPAVREYLEAVLSEPPAFVTRAIDSNVLIIPGSVFSARDTHFRLSYATSDERLARGLEILTTLR